MTEHHKKSSATIEVSTEPEINQNPTKENDSLADFVLDLLINDLRTKISAISSENFSFDPTTSSALSNQSNQNAFVFHRNNETRDSYVVRFPKNRKGGIGSYLDFTVELLEKNIQKEKGVT